MYLRLKLNTMEEKKFDISPILYILLMVTVFAVSL